MEADRLLAGLGKALEEVSDNQRKETTDDWLPEHITPRLGWWWVALDAIRFNGMPIALLYFIYDLHESGSLVLIQIDGLEILNGHQLIVLVLLLCTSLLSWYWWKHILRYYREGPQIRVDKDGIFCRKQNKLFPWSMIGTVYVRSGPARNPFASKRIGIGYELDPKNEDKSFRQWWSDLKGQRWRLDGTDVHIRWLRRCANRWHKLAHERKNAQSDDGSLKDR